MAEVEIQGIIFLVESCILLDERNFSRSARAIEVVNIGWWAH